MDARILPDAFGVWYEALHVKALRDGSGSDRHPLRGDGETTGSLDDDGGAVLSGALEKAEGKPVGQWRVSTGESTSLGKSPGPKMKQVGKTSRFMGDERAWAFKRKIDKRLRRIAKEIHVELDKLERGVGGPEPLARRCAGKCGRFGEPTWHFCANCGGPMREVEASD